VNLCVISHPPSKPEFFENDPDQLDKLLKIELEQRRTEWKQASARYRSIRSFSFLFLFLVVAGGLVGLFFVLTRFQH
jgi:hypothetical protein